MAAHDQWEQEADHSLSDTDLETISCEELVIFDTTRSFYTNKNDIVVQYTSGNAVDISTKDWVGLFQSGWRTPSDVAVFQWAPLDPISQFQPRTRLTIFPQMDVKELLGDFQFLYVTGDKHVIGVSEIFQIIDEDIVQCIQEKLPHSLSLISLETASSSSSCSVENQISEATKKDDDKAASDRDADVSAELARANPKPRACSPVGDSWTLSDFVIGVGPDLFMNRLRVAEDVQDIVEEYEPLKNFNLALRQNSCRLVEEIDPTTAPTQTSFNPHSPAVPTTHISGGRGGTKWVNWGSEQDLAGCSRRIGSQDNQSVPYIPPRKPMLFSMSRDKFRRSYLDAFRKTSSESRLSQQLNSLRVNPLLSQVNDVKKWSNTLIKDKLSGSSCFQSLSEETLQEIHALAEDSETAKKPETAGVEAEEKRSLSKQLLPIFRKRSPAESDERDPKMLTVAIPPDPTKWNLPFVKNSQSVSFAVSHFEPTLPPLDVGRQLLPGARKSQMFDSPNLSYVKRGEPRKMLADTLTDLVTFSSPVSRLASFTQGTSSGNTLAKVSSVGKPRMARPRKRLGQALDSCAAAAKRLRLSAKKTAVTKTSNESSDVEVFTASGETVELLNLALCEALKENCDLRRKVAILELETEEEKNSKTSSSPCGKKGKTKNKSSKSNNSTNTAAAPAKQDSASQSEAPSLTAKATNTAAAPAKKDNSSQCVKAKVVGKATNTTTPSRKDSSSQCAKKKLVGKGTNTAAAPAKKDAENNTTSVPKVESSVQCNTINTLSSLRTPAVRTTGVPNQADAATTRLADPATTVESELERWRVVSSKRMVRLRRMISKKKEEFARLRENVANYERKTEIMEAQLKNVRSTLYVETTKRMTAENDLRELRTKFWELLAARQVQPWSAKEQNGGAQPCLAHNPPVSQTTAEYTPQLSKKGDTMHGTVNSSEDRSAEPSLPSRGQGAVGEPPKSTEEQERASEEAEVEGTAYADPTAEHFTAPFVVSCAPAHNHQAPRLQQVKKASSGVVSFKKFLMSPVTAFAKTFQRSEPKAAPLTDTKQDDQDPADAELTQFIQSQPAFSLCNFDASGPDDFKIHSFAETGKSRLAQKPEMSAANETSHRPALFAADVPTKDCSGGKSEKHTHKSSHSHPVINQTVSDGVATVTVSITSGLGIVTSTASSTGKVSLKSGKKVKVERQSKSKTRAADVSDLKVHRCAKGARSKSTDCGKVGGNLKASFRDRSPEQTFPLPVSKDLEKVKRLEELDQETDEWCPPFLEGDVPFTDAASLSPGAQTNKTWSPPKLASERRGRYASYAAVVSGKFTKNDLARQLTSNQPKDAQNNADSVCPDHITTTTDSTTTDTPSPADQTITSPFAENLPLPDVVTVPPKPQQVSVQCSSLDPEIDLHDQEGPDLTLTPPRAFHFDPLKLYSQSINQQIRRGKCLTCGMRFSPTVDRFLVEEHIFYHHNFAE